MRSPVDLACLIQEMVRFGLHVSIGTMGSGTVTAVFLWTGAAEAEYDRRVHPRELGDQGRPPAQLARRDRYLGRGGQGTQLLSRQPLGERLLRFVQEQAARRVPQLRALLLAQGGAGADRALARNSLPNRTGNAGKATIFSN
jgi:hypothetical protein